MYCKYNYTDPLFIFPIDCSGIVYPILWNLPTLLSNAVYPHHCWWFNPCFWDPLASVVASIPISLFFPHEIPIFWWTWWKSHKITIFFPVKSLWPKTTGLAPGPADPRRPSGGTAWADGCTAVAAWTGSDPQPGSLWSVDILVDVG